ncbi:MAG: haloacid dehalogenase-like hydrolase [Rickettsiales bacterium]|jgi:HAD superfamily phosphoserine phosphatase-like hydrolase|nr:haloacid dehalogenase-like hydrolase [Rickettsiales bacterium]
MGKLIVFDFDGTLSSSDTNFEFWKFAMRRSVRPYFFLPLTIFGMLIKPLNKNGAFWREISRLWISVPLLKKLRNDFIKEHLKKRFGWAAEQVRAEKAKRNIVICISASPDYFVRELVGDMGFDLVLCSITDKKKPWKYKFLCYGENKLAALNLAIKKNYEIARAYSDNKSDLPIMKLANDKVWINPQTGCRINQNA